MRRQSERGRGARFARREGEGGGATETEVEGGKEKDGVAAMRGREGKVRREKKRQMQRGAPG